MAVETTHSFTGNDGVKVLTSWTDTKFEAHQASEAFRNQGAYFTRTFTEKGCLGKYRITGHFYPEVKP
jgi:hypothetical protein